MLDSGWGTATTTLAEGELNDASGWGISTIILVDPVPTAEWLSSEWGFAEALVTGPPLEEAEDSAWGSATITLTDPQPIGSDWGVAEVTLTISEIGWVVVGGAWRPIRAGDITAL